MKELLHRIKHKLMKMRLQPIRVYCLHHVCAEFDAESMNACDWIQIDEFKTKVQALRHEGVEFISLTDAYWHICEDRIRCKKYAVLTFDDGYASLKEVLPWLEEQKIPCTLFVNGKYLDGKSYRNNPKERYLTKDELFALVSPYIEIGSHGWEHTNAIEINSDEFKKCVQTNKELLSMHPRYIPFHAYTWGKHSVETDRILSAIDIMPVYMDGKKNYSDSTVIHRELIDK